MFDTAIGFIGTDVLMEPKAKAETAGATAGCVWGTRLGVQMSQKTG